MFEIPVNKLDFTLLENNFINEQSKNGSKNKKLSYQYAQVKVSDAGKGLFL